MLWRKLCQTFRYDQVILRVEFLVHSQQMKVLADIAIVITPPEKFATIGTGYSFYIILRAVIRALYVCSIVCVCV